MTSEDHTMSVGEFYAGRSVLLTGGTGFMGKVLVEKLLRSCPTLARIFILVRAKRGHSAQERVDLLLSNQLFDGLRDAGPRDFKEKVIAVSGDILEEGLGISQSDVSRLASEVSVVFHSAATVKFDEALKMSVKMNVLGVRKLLELCKQLPKLEAFVHVSTAYANCDKSIIGEQIYTPLVHPQKVLDAVEWMSDELLTALTPTLIAPRPNTYTFTKALAEYVLVEERGSLPCAIVRPSIVGAAWQEPVPGWVDNYNGPTGLLAAIGNGLLRIMYGRSQSTADIIPVDLAVNLVIATAWHTAVERPRHVKVYNGTTGHMNKLTWGDVERASFTNFTKHPLDTVLRIPDPKFTTNRLWYQINVLLDHWLPAYVLDLVCKVCGQRVQHVRLQDRLWRSVRCLEYFTSHEWTFDNDNLLALANQLSASDKQVFNFDPRTIDWTVYLENYCLGIRRYMLNQDMNNLAPARQRLLRLTLVWRIFSILSVLLASRMLLKKSARFRAAWLALLSTIVGVMRRFHLTAQS